MKAQEIVDFIESIAPSGSGAGNEANHFLLGDAEMSITGVCVTWMPTTPAIKKAIENGQNMMVVHESLYYQHQSSTWYEDTQTSDKPTNQRRKKLLEDNNMCIFRSHSPWDAKSEDGVVDAIAKALGFSKVHAKTKFTRVYEIAPTSLKQLAEDVGQNLSCVTRCFGDGEKTIAKVSPLIGGFGGNQVNMPEMVWRMGAEAIILGDMIEYIAINALELGVGVIETVHSSSENPGMRCLTAILKAQFPQIPVEFVDGGIHAFAQNFRNHLMP